MSSVPEGWEIKRVGDVCDVLGGKRIPKGETLVSHDTGRPYLRVADMFMGGVHTEDLMYVPSHVVPQIERYRIYEGDLFISVAGTLGIVGKLPKALDGANLTENANKLTNVSICSDYLLASLQSESIQRTIENEKTTNAQPKLALARIRNFQIPLPPLPEQKRIAAILSSVDDAIAATQAVIDQTRKVKEGLLQDLLTKGIGHTKFKQTEIGEIPEGWEVRKLGHCLDKIEGGGTPSKNMASYWNGGIPWATVKDVTNGIAFDTQDHISLKGLKESATRLVPAGTILFVARMAVGCVKQFEVDVAINQDLKALHPTNELSTGFLFQWLKGHQRKIMAASGGSTVKGIGVNTLKAFDILLPSLAEQKLISNILNEVDRVIENQNKRLAQLQQTKRGLMQDLLSGAVRVAV